MNGRIVLDYGIAPDNGRNSEGAFLRAPDGELLFAYSRYSTPDWSDGAACDIALIRSADEGEHWSEPSILVRAAEFGVQNVMSVSGMTHTDGSLGFYFLIKENDESTTLGRAVSPDGRDFSVSRCRRDFPAAYYVVNNDRLQRLRDGRIVAPAARICPDALHIPDAGGYSTVCLYSEDEGASFRIAPFRLEMPSYPGLENPATGLQEPGLVELQNGVIWMYMRTSAHFQYESFSLDGMRSFTPPMPSRFTSPCSPMLVKRGPDGTLYAAYNPTPPLYGVAKRFCDRTPFVLCKSTDDGQSWNGLNVVEDDFRCGFNYPAIYFTRDNAMLLAYAWGSGALGDDNCLARLRIRKLALSDIG